MPGGIAASVAKDSDLAAHPSVLFYQGFISEADLRSSMVGINTGQPLVPGSLEFVEFPELGMKGAKLWAQYADPAHGIVGNEKIVAWWFTAEPKLSGARARPWHRDYGQGYEHTFCRYMIRPGVDTVAADAFGGGKFPGAVMTYDVYSEGILPPRPDTNGMKAYSRFAVAEARIAYNLGPDGRIYYGVYYYGVRNPDLSGGKPGLPASLGRFDSQGNPAAFTLSGYPAGPLRSTGSSLPGEWACLEQEVLLNTVKDEALFFDAATDSLATAAEIAAAVTELSIPPGYQYSRHELAAIRNANRDGVIRLWLNGVKVYENTTFAMRGMKSVRIQTPLFVNIYQGGRQKFPKAPEHYDLAALVAATEYIGPPKLAATQPEGDDMEVVDVTFDPTKVDLRINQPTGTNPLQPEVDRLNGLLTAANAKIAAQGTWIDAAIADAQAAKARDDANVEGDSILKRPRP